MPQILDRCVADLMKNPNFKPKKKGQSKESAAYAVCNASINKVSKSIEEVLTVIKSKKI